MLEKRAFPKKGTKINTKDDYGLEYDVNFVMWDDPGRRIVGDLLRIVVFTTNEEFSAKSKEEQVKDSQTYFEAVSQVVLDCDVEGSDFSDADAVTKTYELPGVSWGFWYDVIAIYCMKLLNESDNLKKARAALVSLTNSGTDSGNKAASE